MHQMTFLDNPLRFVITVVVTLVILWILIRFRRTKERDVGSLDILKERMEKGEITEKEYEKAKRRQGKE